jgi:3-hydroxypropanoate dehydrogenase
LSFAHSPEAKVKILRWLTIGNIARTQTAPVTIIIANGEKFHGFLPRLFP